MRRIPAVIAALGLAAAGAAHAADPRQANTALLERYFADVNAHDVEALKDVISASYVQHGAGQGTGLAGMQAAFRQDFQQFPDFRMTLEDSVVAGDKIVARFLITATHDRVVQFGPGGPSFAPTGKKLAWEGISIWRVADGKFVEHWDVDDVFTLIQQLRAPPAGGKQP